MFITWCCWLHLRFTYLESPVLKENKVVFWLLGCFFFFFIWGKQTCRKHINQWCAEKWMISQQFASVVLPLLSVHAQVFEVARKDLAIYCPFLGLWSSLCLEVPPYSIYIYLNFYIKYTEMSTGHQYSIQQSLALTGS